MHTKRPSDVVRRYFDVFQAKDREAAEQLLGDDFHFSSPRDARIDKAQYFERCWPQSARVRNIVLEKVVEDGADVFVRYVAERTSDSGKFRNTEYMRVEDGRISEVDVYFGRDLPRAP